MANTTFNIPRAHITMALCLPLAVLLGYVLAEPFESSSLAVVVFVLVILAVPIMLKWHHPLLVVSWNALINPVFLPGRADLWLLLAGISTLVAVLNRATNPDQKFISVPSVIRPLLVFTLVVVVTGFLTGGFGSRLLGSTQFGGRRYYYLLGAVLGFVGLISQRVPLERSGLYVKLFFFSGLTGAVGHLAFHAGPAFYFLFTVFSPDYVMDEAIASINGNMEIVRISGLMVAVPAVYGWLFARYGIRGVFDLRRPWRVSLLVMAIAASLFTGFRTTLVTFLLTFAFLFFIERLHRTKFLFVALAVILLSGALLVPFARKLPVTAQRTLAVLPLNLDPVARISASTSSDWRLEMWKVAILDVPKYLFHGKGYSLDPREISDVDSHSFGLDNWEGSLAMGDYHNGPLSVVIPFGIYGVIAFLWFLFASMRLMHRYYRSGASSLRSTNALLLAVFAAKTVLFLFVFGSLFSDMAGFIGLIGLAVALNGPERELAPAEERDPVLQNDLDPGLLPST